MFSPILCSLATLPQCMINSVYVISPCKHQVTLLPRSLQLMTDHISVSTLCSQRYYIMKWMSDIRYHNEHLENDEQAGWL